MMDMVFHVNALPIYLAVHIYKETRSLSGTTEVVVGWRLYDCKGVKDCIVETVIKSIPAYANTGLGLDSGILSTPSRSELA